MDAEAVRLPLLRHVRHPFVDTRERMPLPPVEKFAVCAYPTLQYGAVVFDAGDLHFVGRLELESQDCPAGFGGQRCGDPVGDTFETAVVARTFADVDHVDLPQVVVAVAVKGMPLDAGFVGGQQVAAFDVLDGGVDGKPRHGGETVARMQRCGVDVEIDVAVSGQQRSEPTRWASAPIDCQISINRVSRMISIAFSCCRRARSSMVFMIGFE